MKKMKCFIILSIISLIISTPIFGGDDHDKIANQIISLNSKLNIKSLDELRDYALNLENYMINGQLIIGGIHDYINTATKEEIKKYIMNVCLRRRELLDPKKFDTVVLTNSTEKSIYLETLSVKSEPIIGGLHDYIYRVEIDVLKRWALAAEAHHKKMTNDQSRSELIKRIEMVTKEELINYLLEKVNLYPGINSGLELDRLSEVYGIVSHTFGKNGGLHDYLFRQNRETLIRWALTSEAHDRKVNNWKFYGGLHDRISSMSNLEIAKYILEKSKIYPELDSGVQLDKMANLFGIDVDKSLLGSIGGIHDYIFRQDRNTLIKWALTSEFHDRIEKKTELLGGLHDYVESLSNTEIAEYILGMVDLYPTLNSKENLESLVEKYQIKYEHREKQIDSLNSDNSLKFLATGTDDEEGGLVDYIYRLPREILSKYAFAVEKYIYEKKGIEIKGGIKDYIDDLNNVEIARFIMSYEHENKELNSKMFLDQLVYKYGF